MIVCLDANIVIYLIEPNTTWTPRAIARVAGLRAAGHEIAACDASRLECLVLPFATANLAEQGDYMAFFHDPTVRMLSVTPEVWERAARVRARYRFQPLDSIHLAAAIEHGCGLFLTNDALLSRCRDIAVMLLT